MAASNEHIRGYAVTATVSRPSKSLKDSMRDKLAGCRNSHSSRVAMRLRLPGVADNIWEPVRERSGGSRGRPVRGRFDIPEPLRELNDVIFGLEAKEVGAVDGEGEDALIDFVHVVTGSWGQVRRPYRLDYGNECERDWHYTSGVFSGKKLGRVGITRGYQLDIDQTEIQVEGAEFTISSVPIFHNPEVESLDYPPKLPQRLESWQLATNGLWQRMACGGCELLHFAND